MSDHALDHAVMRSLEHDGVDYRNRYDALMNALRAFVKDMEVRAAFVDSTPEMSNELDHWADRLTAILESDKF